MTLNIQSLEEFDAAQAEAEVSGNGSRPPEANLPEGDDDRDLDALDLDRPTDEEVDEALAAAEEGMTPTEWRRVRAFDAMLMARTRVALVGALEATAGTANLFGPIRTLSHVEEREVSWLWGPWIARGTLTAVAGPTSVGKTWFTSEVLAKVSRGDPLPSGDDPSKMVPVPKAPVIIIQKEIAESQVLKPRIIDLGGDGDWVVVPSRQEVAAFRFGTQKLDSYLRLAFYIEKVRDRYGVMPAAIYFDPIKSFFDGKTNEDLEVRVILERLATVADFYGVAIIYANHWNKNERSSAGTRQSGSQEFQNVPRSVITCMEDPEAEVPAGAPETLDRLVFHQKPYITPGPNLAYRIQGFAGERGRRERKPLVWTWRPADQKVSAQDLTTAAVLQAEGKSMGRPSKVEGVRDAIYTVLIKAGLDGTTQVEAETLKMLVMAQTGEALSDSTYRRAYKGDKRSELAPMVIGPYEVERGHWVWPTLVPTTPLWDALVSATPAVSGSKSKEVAK